ncbi:MAG: phospholipid carrier-dependent glycosyltransferase [Actinomycetota bacterium]|nr:phospholipid carrier-dependent glycosyltransferase [Actinomycetota bacterium]
MEAIEGAETDPRAERGPSRWGRADTFALTGITVAAAVLRLVRLDDPKSLVFDETYYAKDACWYVTSAPTLCGIDVESTLVHPPLAKWLLALGIRLFGYDSFGWRISAAVAGTITVALLFLLARRLLRSTLGASLAAGLLAIDLLHFVESRIAMLDVFVPLFGVAAVLFLVYDRDWLFAGARGEAAGPRLLQRPWRIAAGIAAGLAVASKWSGGFFLVMLIVLTVAWEIKARREREEPRPILNTFRREGAGLLVWFIVVPALVYTATYIGRTLPPGDGLCPDRNGSWVVRYVEQQQCMFRFHRELESNHSYQSPAWSWLALKRPVSYYFETNPNGDYKEIFATGSPFVWWTSLLALAAVVAAWVRRGDPWRPEGVILAGFLFTYAPWLISGLLSDRSAVFLFYLLPTVPFMCLALGYIASRIGRSWEAIAAIGLFTAAALWFFVFYYPLLTKVPLPQPEWDKRIWVFDNCEKPPADPATAVVTETLDGKVSTRTTFTTGTAEDLPPTGWCWI